MAETREIEVLKKALLLERQGRAFYQRVSKDSESEAVSSLFAIMAASYLLCGFLALVGGLAFARREELGRRLAAIAAHGAMAVFAVFGLLATTVATHGAVVAVAQSDARVAETVLSPVYCFCGSLAAFLFLRRAGRYFRSDVIVSICREGEGTTDG